MTEITIAPKKFKNLSCFRDDVNLFLQRMIQQHGPSSTIEMENSQLFQEFMSLGDYDPKESLCSSWFIKQVDNWRQHCLLTTAKHVVGDCKEIDRQTCIESLLEKFPEFKTHLDVEPIVDAAIKLKSCQDAHILKIVNLFELEYVLHRVVDVHNGKSENKSMTVWELLQNEFADPPSEVDDDSMIWRTNIQPGVVLVIWIDFEDGGFHYNYRTDIDTKIDSDLEMVEFQGDCDHLWDISIQRDLSIGLTDDLKTMGKSTFKTRRSIIEGAKSEIQEQVEAYLEKKADRAKLQQDAKAFESKVAEKLAQLDCKSEDCKSETKDCKSDNDGTSEKDRTFASKETVDMIRTICSAKSTLDLAIQNEGFDRNKRAQVKAAVYLLQNWPIITSKFDVASLCSTMDKIERDRQENGVMNFYDIKKVSASLDEIVNFALNNF